MKTEIPQWVIEYNNAGHQSGAGKAVKILMDKVKETQTAKNHLQWIYARMVVRHGENENYDYMIKFKEIIDNL